MADSSFALDILDRQDLALDLLETEGLFGEWGSSLAPDLGPYLVASTAVCTMTV